MGVSVFGPPAVAAPSGLAAPMYALSPTSSFTTAAGTLASDSAMSLVVTGRRFYFDYRFHNPVTNGTSCGVALGWTDTSIGGFAEMEFAATANFLVSGYSNVLRTTLNLTTSNTVASASAPAQGPFRYFGMLDFATTGTRTLTPGIQTQNVESVYGRRFSVQVIA